MKESFDANIVTEAEKYVQYFNSRFGNKYTFQYQKTEDDKHFFIHNVKDLGDFDLIVKQGHVMAEARVDLEKKEAIIEMVYELTGGDMVGNIVGRVKSTNGEMSYEGFEKSKFSASDSRIK
jgi:hypothetical protein